MIQGKRLWAATYGRGPVFTAAARAKATVGPDGEISGFRTFHRAIGDPDLDQGARQKIGGGPASSGRPARLSCGAGAARRERRPRWRLLLHLRLELGEF